MLYQSKSLFSHPELFSPQCCCDSVSRFGGAGPGAGAASRGAMELSPSYSESPPDGSVAAACCDFTTCCYSGLCAVLCFTGVAITFIFRWAAVVGCLDRVG